MKKQSSGYENKTQSTSSEINHNHVSVEENDNLELSSKDARNRTVYEVQDIGDMKNDESPRTYENMAIAKMHGMSLA